MIDLAKIKPYAHIGITVLSLLVGGYGATSAHTAKKEAGTARAEVVAIKATAPTPCPKCAACVARVTVVKPDPIKVEFPGFIPAKR